MVDGAACPSNPGRHSTVDAALCPQTNERKEAMCFALRDALSVGSIALFSPFVCNSLSERETLKILDDEARNFSILVEAPRTPFGKGKQPQV